MYTAFVLDNGLRVLLTDMPHARSVSICVLLGAGSRLESPEHSGISHFVEHMLFKGTERRPSPGKISEAIEAVGGVMNAETSKELTAFWVKVPQPHWKLAIEVLSDLLLHSLFDLDEIEKERRVIAEELKALQDEPGDLVHVLVDEVLWQGCSLGWDVAGTLASVEQLDRGAMLEYMSRYYVPENAVVSIAGNLPSDTVLGELARRFGGWSAGPTGPWTPASVSDQPRVLLRPKRTVQEHLCLAVPGLAYTDPDRFALDLTSVILGEGMSSRLFVELRDRRGLAYDVHSYVNYYRDAGSLVVYAGVEPSRADAALATIIEQLDRLTSEITAEELSKAKEYWKGRLTLGLEDTHAVASWIGAQEMLLGHVRSVEEIIALVDRIEVTDVVRVAHRLFQHDLLRLAAVGPLVSAKKLARYLMV